MWLRRSTSSGSTPHAYASSSSALPSANDPGASPGARIAVGVGTSSRARRCVTAMFGMSNSIVVTPPADSTNVPTRDDSLTTSCSTACQPAVARRADAQVLVRLAAAPARREHLLARQHELHRAVRELRRHRGDHGVRPEETLAAETAAEERRDHAHALLVEREVLRERGARSAHPLRRVVHGQLAVAPLGDRHRRLERVVVLGRRDVARVDPHVARRVRGFRLAAPRLDVVAEPLRGRIDLVRGLDRHLGALHVVLDAQQRRAFARRLERRADHRRDVLPVVVHLGASAAARALPGPAA